MLNEKMLTNQCILMKRNKEKNFSGACVEQS